MIDRLETAVDLLKPAFLSGFTSPDWIRLLQENRREGDARYVPRAIIATLSTAAPSIVKGFEDRIALDSIDAEAWRRPVFVLGLARSGTTLLFHLLAKDPTFAFPTRFDCYNPHTFVTLRRPGLHRLASLIPSRKRFVEDVETGRRSPAEDKIALCVLAASGNRLYGVFPRTYAGVGGVFEPASSRRGAG